MRVLAIMVLACLIATPGPPLRAADKPRPPQAFWASTCGYCHGKGVARELRGLGLPPLLVAMVVRQGMPGMPAFHRSEIGEQELAAFSDWLSKVSAPEPKQ